MVADDLELREQMSAEHRIRMQHDGLRSSRPLEDEAFGRLSGASVLAYFQYLRCTRHKAAIHHLYTIRWKRTLKTIIQVTPHPHRDTATHSSRSLVRQIRIHEPEVRLAQERPPAFPVKVRILPLLVVVGDRLRLGVSLEPGEVLFVEAP